MTAPLPPGRVRPANPQHMRGKHAPIRPANPQPPHCETCICGRRAPVQNSYEQPAKGRGRKPYGTVSWAEHLKAYEDYSARYGTQQSAERLAERGGFGYWEITDHLGHEPTTWSVR